jgi:toxin ParE1/3/4
MTTKPVIPREAARRGVEAAIEFYATEAGEPVAFRFIDALETAYGAIGRCPAVGSPRYGHELDLPGLRSRRLKGYAPRAGGRQRARDDPDPAKT